MFPRLAGNHPDIHSMKRMRILSSSSGLLSISKPSALGQVAWASLSGSLLGPKV